MTDELPVLTESELEKLERKNRCVEGLPVPARDMTLFKYISQDAHEQAEKMAIVADRAINLANKMMDDTGSGEMDEGRVRAMAQLIASSEKLARTALMLVARGGGRGNGKKKERTVGREKMTSEEASRLLKEMDAKEKEKSDGAQEE
jgi:hypothetical protein